MKTKLQPLFVKRKGLRWVISTNNEEMAVFDFEQEAILVACETSHESGADVHIFDENGKLSVVIAGPTEGSHTAAFSVLSIAS